MPFTFTFDGSFFKLSRFFQRLQDYIQATNTRVSVSGRLMTLNSIALTAGPKGFPDITATAEATTYVVPADQGLFAGATPSSPTRHAGRGPAAGLARRRRVGPLRRRDRGG